jgi:hypothetical protein
MQYRLIQIIPQANNSWDVREGMNGQDRVETETIPNASGFYWYPETKRREVAFEELRKVMLAARLEQLDALFNQMLNLAKLQL